MRNWFSIKKQTIKENKKQKTIAEKKYPYIPSNHDPGTSVVDVLKNTSCKTALWPISLRWNLQEPMRSKGYFKNSV